MALTTNRMTGLFSGMDTDALVKSMVYNQQAKIDLLSQKKQKAEWKIAGFNDFNTKLKALRDTYGSVMGSNSLMSKATYSDFKVNMAENNSVKITAGAGAKAGNYNVVVKNVATAETAKSEKLSAATGGLDSKALKNTSIGNLSQLAKGAFTTTDSEFSFSINGESFTFSTDDSLQAVIDKVNASGAGVTMSYSQIDDKITITSKQLGEYKGVADPGERPEEPGAFSGEKPNREDYNSQSQYDRDLETYQNAYDNYQSTVMAEYNKELAQWNLDNETYQTDQKKQIELEDTDGFLAHLGIDPGNVTRGQDANVSVNGQDFTLSDNSITLDGIQLDFIRSTDPAGIDFDLTPSTDKAFDAIKKFVEDFNNIVKELYTALNQKVSKDYSPLTDEQREQLSETEIENWEAKAKEGIFYRDNNVDRLYSGLRSLLTKSFGGMGKLSSIGITTGSYSAGTAFEIQIDEEKLRKTLESNADGVYELFSASSSSENSGFVTQVNSLIDTFTKNTKTRDIDALNKNIQSYTKSIAEQQDKLETMSDKYYLQYAKLETALSEMQSQQDSLASLMGGGA